MVLLLLLLLLFCHLLTYLLRWYLVDVVWLLYYIGCDSPTIQPSDQCIEEDQKCSCQATSGGPGTPTYTVHYQSEGADWLVSNGPTYQIKGSGDFSLVCEVNYTHSACSEQWAACYANLSGTVAAGKCTRNDTVTRTFVWLMVRFRAILFLGEK